MLLITGPSLHPQ